MDGTLASPLDLKDLCGCPLNPKDLLCFRQTSFTSNRKWHKSFGFEGLPSDLKTAPDLLILGANFLKVQNAVWNFTNDTVSLQGGMVVVKLTTAVNMELNSVYLIRTTSDVIPAQTELILPVKVSKKGKQKECITAGVIEPTTCISVQNKYMVTAWS